MRKGDIVLVPFPFTDLSGTKNRPALVLAVAGSDVVLAFLSTQLHWRMEADLELPPTPTNGLKKVSVLRLSKIATLDTRLVLGRLGRLSEREQHSADRKLSVMLGLGAA